jgi:probable HAF family extracellular repeat protein
VIVGEFNDSSRIHGFVFSNGNFTTLDPPGSLLTEALGINDTGQIVGVASRVGGFLYSGGSFTPLNVPGAFSTYPGDINDAGEIAGSFINTTGTPQHGFLFSGENFTTLDPPGSIATGVTGINNAGQIVGYFDSASGRHGFVFSEGNFTTLDPPGSVFTMLLGINNAGEIVGIFADNFFDPVQGFVFSKGSFTTFPKVPGSSYSGPQGINDKGEIVGFFDDASGRHGFLATPVPTAPPAITIAATPETLWPPNGKLVPVTITGMITDKDSDLDAITATYEVEDEYRSVQPKGSVPIKKDGTYSFTISLQASRNSNDLDGREYTITVRAFDDEGNEGSAATSVIVPHDQGQGRSIAAR